MATNLICRKKNRHRGREWRQLKPLFYNVEKSWQMRGFTSASFVVSGKVRTKELSWEGRNIERKHTA